MTKKDICLVALLVVLATVYVCLFTNWFKPKTIKIGYTARQLRYYRTRKDLPDVLFLMEGTFRLTDVKVVPLASFQADPHTVPLWHLISDSNSIPVQRFAYGQHIRGMKAALRGAQAQELETNVTYRLFVSAGNTKGYDDFEIQ